jgi:endosialidase-like protein
VRIGEQGTQTATFIAGISGATVTGTAVVVDGNGQLGVAPSSARFKEAIKSMDNASEALFALKPVTFRYKKDIDPQGISQFGLVAEEVEAVNSDLVVRDKEGKPFTVRYEQVNAMLLNEFLKEQKRVQQLEIAVVQQRYHFEQEIAALKEELEAVAARSKHKEEKIQKVNARVELNKTVSRKVANK